MSKQKLGMGQSFRMAPLIKLFPPPQGGTKLQPDGQQRAARHRRVAGEAAASGRGGGEGRALRVLAHRLHRQWGPGRVLFFVDCVCEPQSVRVNLSLSVSIFISSESLHDTL